MSRPLALVTCASTGIGLALAHELATRGYDLTVCSAGPRLKDAAETLRAAGVEVLAVNADLATTDGVKRLWQESANAIPGTVKAAMHEKMAKPKTAGSP